MRNERFGNLVHWAITLGLACVVSACSVLMVRQQLQIVRLIESTYERDIDLWEAHNRHLEDAAIVVEIAENQKALIKREPVEESK